MWVGSKLSFPIVDTFDLLDCLQLDIGILASTIKAY